MELQIRDYRLQIFKKFVIANKAKILLTILLFVNNISFSQENVNVLFANANKAYTNGEYTKALTDYSEILSKGYESAELFYNIGNARYKTGDFAGAILYYEKALKLNPTNADIKANIALANLKITDKVEAVPQLFFMDWWYGFRNSKSVDGWAIWSIVALFISVILIVWFLISNANYRNIVATAGFALLFVSLLSYSMAKNQYNSIYNSNEGIIMNPSVTVKSAPTNNSTDLFVIHEGIKVEVLETTQGWTNIKLSNGNEGWVEEKNLQTI